MIKQFTNIKEAITYHKKCYVCDSELQPTFHDNKIEYFYTDDQMHECMEINLSNNIDSDTDDILSIDMENNSVKLNIKKRYDILYYNDPSYRLYSRKYSATAYSYGGILYESILVNCIKCRNFSYVVRMIIDVEKYNRITDIMLNSEYITLIDHDNFSQIVNVYTTEETKYRNAYKSKYFDADDFIVLPLIPLNLENPHETLSKIKKLLPFT
jgi:hypothetical protein